ncbi:MAG: cytochrome c-type biogenesis protein CcmH [Candidatus Acidiferrales bacterium]
MTRSCKKSARVAALLVALAMCNATYSHAQDTARAKALAQKMMCVCGCNQILGACNHVGCTYSHDMIKEVEARVARNEPDDLTLQAFVQEYGPSVLIEPPAKGFNLTAWIMPVVVPMISLVILWEVVRRWRQRAAVATASGPRVSPELLARARQEAGKDE